MALPENPYLLQDITTIIDAFVRATPGATATSLSSSAGAGIDYSSHYLNLKPDTASWAKTAERLQSHIDKANGAVAMLQAYGVQALDTGTNMDALQATLAAATPDNAAAAAMAAIAAQCVPCETRVLAALSLNPSDALMGIVSSMYEQSKAFILNLFDLLLGNKSLGVFSDFCSLFQFLNFMCVPDLYKMIVVIGGLVQKYSFQLTDISINFTAILGKMIGPALQPLLSLLDQFIQLIIGPIDCIIDTLDAQIQKLDVEKAADYVIDKDMNFREGAVTVGAGPASASTGSASVAAKSTGSGPSSMEQAAGAIEGPLKMLKKYLEASAAETKATFAKLQKTLEDFCGIEGGMDDALMSITQNIQMCAQLIGVIQALIKAASQGAIDCGPNASNAEQLNAFINSYVAPQLNLDVTQTATGMQVRPSVGADLSALLGAVGKIQQPAAAPAATVTQVPTVARAFVPISNCLYTANDTELARVKDFLGTIPGGGA